MRRVAYSIVSAIAVICLIAFFGNEILSNRSQPTIDYPKLVDNEPSTIYISAPPTYSKQTLMDNVTGELIDTKYGTVVVKLTNNNPIDVDVTIQIEKVDDQGIVIDDSSDYIDAIAAHSTVYISPYIDGYDADELNLYIDVESSYAVSLASYISYEVGEVDEYDDLPITATNNSDYEPSSVVLSVLFYDEDDTLIEMSQAYYFELYPHASETDEVMIPYDQDYNTINYDHVEILVQSAACYDVEYIEE